MPQPAIVCDMCAASLCDIIRVVINLFDLRHHVAAPVITIAGTEVRVWLIRGTTVAGVRAVATVISAPRSVSPVIISDVRLLMRLSVLRSVPSRSLTYSVRNEFFMSSQIDCAANLQKSQKASQT